MKKSKKIRKILMGSILMVLNFAPTGCKKQISITSNSQETTSPRNACSEPINILSYNVFLLTDIFAINTSQWSQSDRARKISEAKFLDNYDILTLQECFDNGASNTLKKGLSNRFPYQTPVLGRSTNGWDKTEGAWRNEVQSGLEDGGCMIASKYPIMTMCQFIFPKGCNYDAFSLKGFVYAKILKNGKYFHVINTHLQATDANCWGKETEIRQSQLQLIRKYVEKLQIPKSDMVIYTGDFNIEKGTHEYRKMLTTLHVTEPHYAGLPFTWDPNRNSIISYHYPTSEYKGEYLDYVLVSYDHSVPEAWQNLVMDPVSSTLMSYKNTLGKEYYWVELSDHFPVAGFMYADQNTPTHSLRFRPYDKLSLRSVATGNYVNSNLDDIRDWLRVEARTPDSTTWFNMVNLTNSPNSYFKVRPGRVRLEVSERMNYYWYWNLNLFGPYYYYPEYATFSDQLTLEIISKKQGNIEKHLQNGDIVAFKDIDYHITNKVFYVKAHCKHNTDWLYLNGLFPGNWEQFEVNFNQTIPESWKSQLIYH